MNCVNFKDLRKLNTDEISEQERPSPDMQLFHAAKNYQLLMLLIPA